MATENSYPPVPSNYVTIHDLQQRWMKRQQEEMEKEQQPKHEPTLSQPRRRNNVRLGKGRSSTAAIVPLSNRSDSAMEASQAKESRVSGVEEQSALVAVEKTGKKKVRKRKKKIGIDGKGKARLDEDADAGTEHAPVGKVAGDSVASIDILKDGSFEVEVKCVSAESKAMQKLHPKIKSHNRARVKVTRGGITIEKKVSEDILGRVNIKNVGLDTETRSKINIAYPANPTFKVEEELKKLSVQDDRRDYRRGRGGGEMVWVKKVKKADHDQNRSSSELLN